MIQREADDNNMHNKDLQTRSFGGIASVSQSVAQMKAHAKGRRSLVRRCGGDSHRQVGLCWWYASLLMPNVRCCGTLVVIRWTLQLRCCCDCAYAHRRAKKKNHKCSCNVRGNNHSVVFFVLLLSGTLQTRIFSAASSCLRLCLPVPPPPPPHPSPSRPPPPSPPPSPPPPPA